MKSKKTAFMAVFMYCLITSGIWGMLIAYTKSYNKLSAEKIEPVSLTVKSDNAYIKILENKITGIAAKKPSRIAPK